jgi:hypothetical protein
MPTLSYITWQIRPKVRSLSVRVSTPAESGLFMS